MEGKVEWRRGGEIEWVRIAKEVGGGEEEKSGGG